MREYDCCRSIAMKNVIEETFPLTANELGLWFEYNLVSRAYNNIFGFRVRAELDDSCLRKALDTLVSRHKMLRTVFRYTQNEVMHHVQASNLFEFSVSDLSDSHEEQLSTEISKETAVTFLLDRLPLFRVKKIIISKLDNIIIFNTPHIISDGPTYGILLEELLKLYVRLKRGMLPSLPTIKEEFADYVVWQSNLFRSPKGKQLWEFWEKNLAGELPILDLCPGQSVAIHHSDFGARHQFNLGTEELRDLKNLSDAQGVNFYTLLLSIYFVLLHTLTRQKDIIVGSAMSGEGRSRFPRTVGYMVNMVPMRVTLRENPSVIQIIKAVQDTFLDAIDHQEFSLPHIIQRLEQKVHPGYTPIFQASFALQSAGSFFNLSAIHETGLPVEILNLEQGVGQYDLSFRAMELNDSFTFAFQYRRNVFDELSIVTLENQFRSIVKKFLSNERPHLSDFPPLQREAVAITSQNIEANSRKEESLFTLPRNELEQKLAQLWCETAGIERISVFEKLFQTGGDSIIALQYVMKVNASGLNLSLGQIYQHQTIAELSKLATPTTPGIDNGLVFGESELTPIQTRYFEQDPPDPHYYFMLLYLETFQEPDTVLIERAIWHLMAHHDFLRARFFFKNGKWKQYIADLDEQVSFCQVDLSISPIDQESVRDSKMLEIANHSNLTEGPLIKAILFRNCNKKSHRLQFLIHHLVCDVVSLGVLKMDFCTAYDQLARGEDVALPKKSSSYKIWAEKLKKYADNGISKIEENYWLSKAGLRGSVFPVDFPHGANTLIFSKNLWLKLDRANTEFLLKGINKIYGTQINDLLLAALAIALHRWADIKSFWVDLEGHGREEIFSEIEISRTVGWFTSVTPILLSVDDPTDVGNTLLCIKRTLQEVPNHGVGFGILKFLSERNEIQSLVRTIPKPQILFNYVGQLDQLFNNSSDSLIFKTVIEDKSGIVRTPKAQLAHEIIVHPRISGGEFKLEIIFSGKRFSIESMEKFGNYYLDALRSIINHCKDQSPSSTR